MGALTTGSGLLLGGRRCGRFTASRKSSCAVATAGPVPGHRPGRLCYRGAAETFEQSTDPVVRIARTEAWSRARAGAEPPRLTALSRAVDPNGASPGNGLAYPPTAARQAILKSGHRNCRSRNFAHVLRLLTLIGAKPTRRPGQGSPARLRRCPRRSGRARSPGAGATSWVARTANPCVPAVLPGRQLNLADAGSAATSPT